MWVGLEASGHVPRHATARGRAAHGDHTEHARPEGRRDSTRQRPHHEWLTRAATLPFVLVVVACEIAWLLLLAYAAHRFLLQPILEY